MKMERELRRQMERGNEYLNVIKYAIRIANERGDRIAAAWIVDELNRAKRKVSELR